MIIDDPNYSGYPNNNYGGQDYGRQDLNKIKLKNPNKKDSREQDPISYPKFVTSIKRWHLPNIIQLSYITYKYLRRPGKV